MPKKLERWSKHKFVRKKRFTDILRRFNRGRCTALMKDDSLALKGQKCKQCNSGELDKVKKKHPGELGMKSLTPYQANGRTRVGVRTVRRHPARPGMKSLTNCQANRTRVWEWCQSLRRYPAESSMKSLTPCQANRGKVGMRSVWRHPAKSSIKTLSLTNCKVQ